MAARGRRGLRGKSRSASDPTVQVRIEVDDPGPTEMVPAPQQASQSGPARSSTRIYRADPPAAAVGVLIALAGPAVGQVFALRDGESILGSGDGVAVHIDSEYVSARQLRIVHSNGDFAVEPLGGPNPVQRNGVELGSGVALRDGDVITVADTRLSFRTATPQ